MNRYEDLPELMTRMTGDEKHAPSATSTLDVLWTLYDRVLRLTPESVDAPDRDRFLLSKGHGPMAFYAVLAAKGFIPSAWLDDFGRFDSPLGQHPDRNLIPGVEIASGSLGHGLPIALGVALALDVRADTRARVFVLIGDAELDEGSNHEAIALAGRMRVERLTAVVVDNASAAHGWPSAAHGWLGGIERRFALEDWATATVDGHDHSALAAALGGRATVRPRVVVARTSPKEA
ncbi:MAG: thiamine pyrophosphate-dependent enzyme [Thiotrichales bacterium]|nr:thiamine pyrophosphate-dependent enzyme [Thiotrichales bacterium]